MYRIVIHGLVNRQSARELVERIDRDYILSDWIGDDGTVTIEPDDTATAERPGGAATEWLDPALSLRKDTGIEPSMSTRDIARAKR